MFSDKTATSLKCAHHLRRVSRTGRPSELRSKIQKMDHGEQALWNRLSDNTIWGYYRIWEYDAESKLENNSTQYWFNYLCDFLQKAVLISLKLCRLRELNIFLIIDATSYLLAPLHATIRISFQVGHITGRTQFGFSIRILYCCDIPEVENMSSDRQKSLCTHPPWNASSQ